MKKLTKENIEARLARLKVNAIENERLIKKWERKLKNITA